MLAPLETRFWAAVEKRGPNDCWPWRASRDRYGYGQIQDHGKKRGAHRVSWKLAHGQEPEGCVCHSCDNPQCVNPAHLWVGTHLENVRDAMRKGRLKGSRSYRSGVLHAVCRRGHELTPENASPNGRGRTCRICLNARRALRSISA